MTDPSAPETISGADLVERVIESRVLHVGKFLTFRVDTVERADGSRATRDIAGHPGAVAIVALDGDGRVALVRQWRVPAGRALLEIPAGGLDVHGDGTTEDPDLAAARELEEETGLRAGSWRKLATFFSAPGFTEELMHLYLATDLSSAAADGRLGPDEDERLIVEWRPWPEAVGAIESGEICDAKSIVGLLWLERLVGRGDLGAGAGSAAPSGVVTGQYRLGPGEAARAIATLVGRSLGMRVLGFLLIAASFFSASVGDVLAVFGLIVGVGLVSGLIMVPFAFAQAVRRPDRIGADITVSASSTGIIFAADGRRLEDPWAIYREVRSDATMIALLTHRGQSRLIPIRAFDDAGLAAFRALLDERAVDAGRKASPGSDGR